MEDNRLKSAINRLRSEEGYLYAGYPRYMGLFGRDSLITGWELLEAEPDIMKHSLGALAKAQGKTVNRPNGEEPGKILHEYHHSNTMPEAWFKEHKSHLKWLHYGIPAYFSVDSTRFS